LTLCLAMVVTALAAVPSANATVIASSSVELESLTIAPSSGVISTFGYNAGVQLIVQSSLGGQAASTVDGANVSASIAVPWAFAEGSAYTLPQPITASALSSVQIPGAVNGTAYSSVATNNIFFYFDVLQTTGPVSVQFSMLAPFAHLLMSDAYGLDGSSSVYAEVCISTGQCVLGGGSNYSIGRSGFIADSGTLNLENAATLTAGQTYQGAVILTTQTIGSNSLFTPEPTTLSLSLGGLATTVAISFRRVRSRRA
jgi:hypothetical protein